MKRPSRTTEIFDVPVEGVASALDCPTNLIARVYSPARFARNACSGPGFDGDGLSAVAAPWFWSECACANAGAAKSVSAATCNSAAAVINIDRINRIG